MGKLPAMVSMEEAEGRGIAHLALLSVMSKMIWYLTVDFIVMDVQSITGGWGPGIAVRLVMCTAGNQAL